MDWDSNLWSSTQLGIEGLIKFSYYLDIYTRVDFLKLDTSVTY